MLTDMKIIVVKAPVLTHRRGGGAGPAVGEWSVNGKGDSAAPPRWCGSVEAGRVASTLSLARAFLCEPDRRLRSSHRERVGLVLQSPSVQRPQLRSGSVQRDEGVIPLNTVSNVFMI